MIPHIFHLAAVAAAFLAAWGIAKSVQSSSTTDAGKANGARDCSAAPAASSSSICISSIGDTKTDRQSRGTAHHTGRGHSDIAANVVTDGSTALMSQQFRTSAAVMCIRPGSGPIPAKTLAAIQAWLDHHPREAAAGRKANFLRRPWRGLTHLEKQIRAAEFAQLAAGRAFTLRLSEGVQDGLKAAVDPAEYMAKRLRRYLNSVSDADIWYGFTIEISTKGELHLHGIISSKGHDRSALADALRGAGGAVPDASTARQLKIKKLDCGHGWCHYSNKDRKKTAAALSSDKLTHMSRSLAALAKSYHEVARPKGKRPAGARADNLAAEVLSSSLINGRRDRSFTVVTTIDTQSGGADVVPPMTM